MPRGVAEGVKAAEGAADLLRKIKDGAQSALTSVREVADATREQSLASTSIAQKVEEIATMVDQTTVADATLDRPISGSIKTVLKGDSMRRKKVAKFTENAKYPDLGGHSSVAWWGSDRELVVTEQRSSRSAKFATERELTKVLRTEIACRLNGSKGRFTAAQLDPRGSPAAVR